MRKQELLHLHELLFLVREDLIERGVAPRDAFAAYEENGVGPSAFNLGKAEHERAIRLLRAGIVRSIAAAEPAERDGYGERQAV